MDMDERTRERQRAEFAERSRLLAMTEAEAMAEGVPIWYQRMRYLREIEAAEWLKKVKAGIVPSAPISRKGYGYGRKQTKVIHEGRD